MPLSSIGVVAYRRQRDLEQGRFVERFGAAAAQLGDPDPAVRIAGVYAMAAAADEAATFGRRQQCIDVLCGYLRLPYDPDHGASHHTEIVAKTNPGAPATGHRQSRHRPDEKPPCIKNFGKTTVKSAKPSSASSTPTSRRARKGTSRW
jgi:hypothetical protein